jgi:hypothetical protein
VVTSANGNGQPPKGQRDYPRLLGQFTSITLCRVLFRTARLAGSDSSKQWLMKVLVKCLVATRDEATRPYRLAASQRKPEIDHDSYLYIELSPPKTQVVGPVD